MDSGGHTGDTRGSDLDQARDGQEKADKSNVDSGELRVQHTRLNIQRRRNREDTDETQIHRKSR